ncbi:hypothetical protein G7084_00250 [Weissella coleopterorum]|uniref:Uncharacterized protein n=1 Tax=Weissella coleopterorum TaxID=2714949 RepID=A0A6G8AY35_9LACO|nr:hypothetical protein [Weissella coleopterorum]QIL49890.1 hypothetical protein G7084_00250 [Weissella coleopterorum]
MDNFGLSIIDENGQAHGLPELLDEKRLQMKSNDEIEDLARNIKYFDKPKKLIMEELKTRLDTGQQFYGVEYRNRQTKIVPIDNNDLKKMFVEKYGWDSVVLKSHTQLKKKFGDDISNDLERITILENGKTIHWK